MNEEPRKSASKFTRSRKNLTSLASNLDVTGGTLIIDVRGRNFLGGLQDSASSRKKIPVEGSPSWKTETEGKGGRAAAATTSRWKKLAKCAEKGVGARWDELFTTLTGRRR